MSEARRSLDDLLRNAAQAPPLLNEDETAVLIEAASASDGTTTGSNAASRSILRRGLPFLLSVAALITALLYFTQSDREPTTRRDTGLAESAEREQRIAGTDNTGRSESTEREQPATDEKHDEPAETGNGEARATEVKRAEPAETGNDEARATEVKRAEPAETGNGVTRAEPNRQKEGSDRDRLEQGVTADRQVTTAALSDGLAGDVSPSLALSASHFAFRWFNLSFEMPLTDPYPGYSLTTVLGSGLLTSADGRDITYMSFLVGVHGWRYFNGTHPEGWRAGLLLEYKHVPDAAEDAYYRAGNGFRLLPAIGYRYALTRHLLLDGSAGAGATWNFDRSDPMDAETGERRTVYRGRFYPAYDIALRLGWRF